MSYGTHHEITQETSGPNAGPPHSSFRWLWADEAERLAETDVLQHDIDTATTGLQLDSGEVYRATALTPTWQKVGGFDSNGRFTVEVRDASNNDDSFALIVRHNVTNTAGDNIGTGIEIQAETTAGGENTPLAQLIARQYDQAGDHGEFVIYVRDGGSVSKLLFRGNGDPSNTYISVGSDATANGHGTSAFGPTAIAEADYAGAFGFEAHARIEKTNNIAGPLITRKDDGDIDPIRHFSSAEVTLFSEEVDLEVVADVTLTLPAGCHFWIDEIGVICTSASGLVTQPTIRFGITGSLAKHKAAAITTLLTAAFKREKFTPLVPQDGETSLTAGVTVAGSATALFGRFYWKGILVEDE